MLVGGWGYGKLGKHCWGVYPRPPIHPKPPALLTAAARGPPDVRAMPARIMGCLIPSRVVRGVVMGPWVAILRLFVRVCLL